MPTRRENRACEWNFWSQGFWIPRGMPVLRFVPTHRSALILACEKGSAEVAELLLSHGADVGAVDSMGHDALYYGMRTQDKELCRLLQQALSRRRRRGKARPFCDLEVLLHNLRLSQNPMCSHGHNSSGK